MQAKFDTLRLNLISKRNGFAIILVAALAGLLFLLGASLVAISQLQRAATNYDHRTRLARDHARASLEIALAELQEALGPDQAISYLADVERVDPSEDFRTPSDVTVSGVHQPFWTYAQYPSRSRWLVTPSLTGASQPDPFRATPADHVTLVGETSVSAEAGVNESLLEVRVPKEAIEVAGLQGFTSDTAIGHYAYWVGDLGVKASYARYDKTNYTNHGPYAGVDNDQRERLRQLRINHPGFPNVDVNLEGSGGPEASNPERIELFVNDFQFRDRYGNADNKERFLIGLDEESDTAAQPSEVSLYFHDFTPLSKGLLTNSATGDFKTDLSKLGQMPSNGNGAYYNANLSAYSELASSFASTSFGYNDHAFHMRPESSGSPAIMPVLTQFNLNYSVYLIKTSDTTADLYFSFNATFELWNPFTSKLAPAPLRFKVKQLPQIYLWWADGTNELFWPPPGDHVDFLSVSFETPSDGNWFWRPGQIVVFSGPRLDQTFTADPDDPEDPVFGVSLGPTNDKRGIFKLGSVVGEFPFGDGSDAAELLKIGYGFQKPGAPDGGIASPVIDVYLSGTDELLASYPLDGRYVLPDSERTGVFTDNSRWLGFSWEVRDSVLPKSDNYAPMDTSIASSALIGFDESAQAPVNLFADIQDSEILLLGYHDADNVGGEPAAASDFPILQLPKQELISISQLGNAFSPGTDLEPVGSPTSDRNDLFDRAFFSTVPLSGWNVINPLPNSGYKPTTPKESDLRQTEDINTPSTFTAAHLYVHGIFNVHSTSIEAWSAMLRASPATSSPHWSVRLRSEGVLAPEGDPDSPLPKELYLFFNYPQSAEDVYDFAFVPAADAVDYGLPEKRASMRNGMFALTEAQIKELASEIVKNVRLRVQKADPYDSTPNGPFTSMEDFVNSRVLENAIADMGDASLNPAWAEPGTARQFNQITILNMLAPYLSVRSDTFLVRAYGDAVNPADSSEIWAKAYCEAIVQRTHQMHADSSLGRKMEVVAFRWLAPSEI